MKNLDLLKEAAALGGYTITAATGDDPNNKIRAQRRLNMIKADVISRYGGKWQPNYREGWLALAAIYSDGTVTFTNGSQTVTGSSTAFTSAMKGRKIKGPDNAYYRIASVTNSTTLIISQPFQGTTLAGYATYIWKDEYALHPEAMSLGGFVEYDLPGRSTEAWPSNMKDSYPFPVSTTSPTVYTVLHKQGMTDAVTTGTVTGSVDSNILTGAGTTWLTGSVPLEPGFEITINSVTYHVRRVNSDTELELYQTLKAAIGGLSYSAKGKNALVVRFKGPTSQMIVHYWYYSKDYPFVNDNDEDWIAEQFPRVLVNGISYFDYIDKNDISRGFNSQQVYENSIKDMRVAMETTYTGIRTLGIYIPDNARD